MAKKSKPQQVKLLCKDIVAVWLNANKHFRKARRGNRTRTPIAGEETNTDGTPFGVLRFWY